MLNIGKSYIVAQQGALQKINPLGELFDHAIWPIKFAYIIHRERSNTFWWSISSSPFFQTNKLSYPHAKVHTIFPT